MERSWMNNLKHWLFTLAECGGVNRLGCLVSWRTGMLQARISNCGGDAIPVRLVCHCYQPMLPHPDQWQRGRGIHTVGCPKMTNLPSLFSLDTLTARRGFTDCLTNPFYFVYVNQEALNGLAHPSWTNNHRNLRNAVRTMLLLLEFISGHSVNCFMESTWMARRL